MDSGPHNPTDTVLVLGEILIDVVHTPDGQVSEHVGGSPANVAAGIARLGHRVDFATTVGDDDRGRRCTAYVEDQGVHVLPTSRTDDPTSTADATIDDGGAATYEFDLHWNLAPLPEDVSAGHVHTGSIGATQAPGADEVERVLRAQREHATISYDPNIRPSIMGDPQVLRPRIESLVALSDLVKASLDDIEVLYPGESVDQVLARWIALGPQMAVITLGGDGVRYRAGTDEPVTKRALVDRVVDTVGAGDSFMSGLISGLLDDGLLGSAARTTPRPVTTDLLRPAIDRALATSGVTVTKTGAYSPTREEIEED